MRSICSDHVEREREPERDVLGDGQVREERRLLIP
jgi:hypothetical protein